jgi:hypothetical protein
MPSDPVFGFTAINPSDCRRIRRLAPGIPLEKCQVSHVALNTVKTVIVIKLC